MNTKLLSLYGMKWNPFSPDVPLEGVHRTRTVESFSWRVENLAREGGFALVTGVPGSGKSVALRLLVDRLSGLRDLKVGLLSRPQANLADFYRELGDIFGVPLRPHNRWAGAKELREKWQAHIETSLFRPVLVVDEAQEMQSLVLNELRLLCSAHLDSSLLLTTVLAGDGRLVQRLQSDEMLPLGSRIRARLSLDRATPEQLRECLQYALEKAGAPKLMTAELMTTLCEHAAGNMRALMTMADELLAQGAQRELHQLDEKLYLELFAVPSRAEPTKKVIAQGGRRR
jgi:type II secretory pathway predicted ATPase ExeA